MTTAKAINATPKANKRPKPAETSPTSVRSAETSPSAQRLGLHAVETARVNKTDAVIAMLREPAGASVDEIMAATGWQRHSVRGALAGAVRKKLGAAVTYDLIDGVRRYRAPEVAA